MAGIELVWFPGTCSRVTLITLEEIGEPFRTRVSPVTRGTDAAFLSVNPKGKVPVLTVDGATLTETPAIVTHLAELYPGAGLLPGGDRLVRIDALATMSWIAAGIHPSITRLRYPLRFCDAPGSAERTRALAAAMLRSCFEVMEERLVAESGSMTRGRSWTPICCGHGFAPSARAWIRVGLTVAPPTRHGVSGGRASRARWTAKSRRTPRCWRPDRCPGNSHPTRWAARRSSSNGSQSVSAGMC